VTESAERALTLVGIKHSLTKRTLVESYSNCCSCISTPHIFGGRIHRDRRFDFKTNMLSVIDSNGKRQACGVVANYKHRPRGKVFPRDKAVKIDQG